MSFVIADPEMVTAAAADLAGIRSTLGAAVEAAAGPTTGVAAAAADEVSAAIAHLFGAYGQEFQALNGRAAAFHAELVRLLNGGAASYLSAEVVNVEALLGQSLNGGAAAAADPLSGLLGSILGTSSGGSGSVGGILGGSGGCWTRSCSGALVGSLARWWGAMAC